MLSDKKDLCDVHNTPSSSCWFLWNWVFKKINIGLLAFVFMFVYFNSIQWVICTKPLTLSWHTPEASLELRKNKWICEKLKQKVGGDQKNKILPITELCYEFGMVPGTFVSFFLSFQTLSSMGAIILIAGKSLEEFMCGQVRGFPIPTHRLSLLT